jgi:hypothetical protein
LVTHSLLITLKYRQYSAIADLNTFQFTVALAPGFPVFTSLLATNLNTEIITVSLDHTLSVLHVNTSSNHTLSLHRSSTNFPWLPPTENSTELTLAFFSGFCYHHSPCNLSQTVEKSQQHYSLNCHERSPTENLVQLTELLALFSLYSLPTDHAETASIVETCSPQRCIATVAARTAWKTNHVIPSQRLQWCAGCCLATRDKHSSYC